MELEDELRQIRGQISTAQSKRARAQVEYDQATERLAETRGSLKSEFGIATGDDAKRVRAELEKSLEDALDKVRSGLAEAGA